MKKLLATTAIALFTMTGAALADTVEVTSKTSFSSPTANISSNTLFEFPGTKIITFTVAGKTCTLNGSARGSVPVGSCNYQITVSSDGAISGELTTGSAGSAVCTPTKTIAAQCK